MGGMDDELIQLSAADGLVNLCGFLFHWLFFSPCGLTFSSRLSWVSAHNGPRIPKNMNLGSFQDVGYI